jgi:hypothetical protein
MCEVPLENKEPEIRNAFQGNLAIKRITNKCITGYASITSYNQNEYT